MTDMADLKSGSGGFLKNGCKNGCLRADIHTGTNINADDKKKETLSKENGNTTCLHPTVHVKQQLEWKTNLIVFANLLKTPSDVNGQNKSSFH